MWDGAGTLFLLGPSVPPCLGTDAPQLLCSSFRYCASSKGQCVGPTPVSGRVLQVDRGTLQAYLGGCWNCSLP